MFKKKRRSYFAGKSCDICGMGATKFRVIGSHTYMLCDSKKCNEYTKRINGWNNNMEIQ